MFIESQKPTWLYGTGSEHTVLYQSQLHKAKSVYMATSKPMHPSFSPAPPLPYPSDRSWVVSLLIRPLTTVPRPAVGWPVVSASLTPLTYTFTASGSTAGSWTSISTAFPERAAARKDMGD